jgi:hypothetical protein
MVGCSEDLLNAVVEVSWDERLMEPLVKLSQPLELPVVDRILQQLTNPGPRERTADGTVRQPSRRGLLGQQLQRVLSRGVPLRKA